jgi:4-alpha-glucanotransferase
VTTTRRPLHDRTSGILLHPTSLPGPHGSGDFGPDAFQFVDWLAGCGQSIWQWLPTTPIGPGDSPYQSVSAFAGSPLLVALEPLVDAGWLPASSLGHGVPPDGFAAHQVDFERVIPWRMARLREAFAGFNAHGSLAQREAFAAWSAQEQAWLDDVALFLALETAHPGQPWWDWPAALAARVPAALAQAVRAHAEEVDFHRFVQWCFDSQCRALKAYANTRGVALMGDLPIFVAHHSADVWARPDLYRLDACHQPTHVAGAPPDAMAPKGQRWGNPLYRWDRMAAEGFAWWTARVRHTLRHADLLRIDHFRGFAAGWEIPADSPDATTGQWAEGPGLALFDALQSGLRAAQAMGLDDPHADRRGPLPIVAEDLGHITPDVHALREACGFAGMKILQFAFGGGIDADANHPYRPHRFTRDCVVYSGTHDNDTTLGWWQAASEDERHIAGSYLACSERDVHWAMIRAALNSVADTAITPLQDVLGLPSPHRMNTPGTMGPPNWRWRFTWDMLGTEPGRVLGLMTRVSGRA